MKNPMDYIIPKSTRGWFGKAFEGMGEKLVPIGIGLFVIALIFVIGMAAVEGAKPVSGTVVEKVHKPDNSGYKYGYTCDGGECGYKSYYEYDPEEWILVIKDCTEVCTHKARQVNEDTYYSFKVGEHYDSERIK